MMAKSGNTLAVQPTRCLKHPKCTTNHFYCIECNRVFCSDCRNEADDRFNHTKHKFFPIETYLQQRRERIATIKSDVRKYMDKHDRLRNSILFVVEETMKNELQIGYDIIDEFSDRLHQTVSKLQSSLRTTFKQQAQLKWASSTNSRLIEEAKNALEVTHSAWDSLEHEMRRAEEDELHLAEGSREMEALFDCIANFMRLDASLPAATDFELRDLKESLNRAVAAFEVGVSEKLDELLARVPHSRVISFTESDVIKKEQLKCQSDSEDPLIRGAVQLNANSMLLLDGRNSSLKKIGIGLEVETVCFNFTFIKLALLVIITYPYIYLLAD